MKFNKRSRLYTCLIGLVLLALWMVWGNMTIQISRVEISDKAIPETFEGYKIAHLSDIHDKSWGKALIEPIQEEKPDMIVITGDLIDSKSLDIYQASQLTEVLKEIAPIYFVTGNHEAWSGHYDLLEESLLNLNVSILANDAVRIQKNDEELFLMGIQDPAFAAESNLLKEPSATIEAQVHELADQFEGYKILLSHRPEFFETYVNTGVNLVLSGHAHGGQFRIPFIGGLIAPDQGFFPEYTSGVYEEGDTKMVVSRGLGNGTIPIRVNNRPELVFIELKNEF